MNLRQLEAFAAVMSSGSITAAARLLSRSQPAVSRLIQELEQSIGFLLFTRSGPRLSPTDQALAFYEEVDRSLVALEQIRAGAQAIRAGAARQIRIAAIPALAVGVVPGALASLPITDDGPPGVEVRSMAAEQVIRRLVDRLSDVGLASLPVDHPGIDLHAVVSAPCVAVVRADDPLAGEARIDLGALAARRFITMSNPYRFRRRVDRALVESGLDRPQRWIETNASSNALALVRSGIGAAVIDPATAVGLPVEGLVVRPLAQEVLFAWGIATPTSKPPSGRTAELVAALKTASLTLLPGARLVEAGGMPELAAELYGADQPDSETTE